MQVAKETFERMAPASFAERVELPAGWTVIRHSHLREKDARRATHGHWAAIICGNRKIYRVLRFSVTLHRKQIVLDWAGWIDLQGRVADAPDQLELEVRTPHWWEYPFIPFSHIDPGYRMSAWLGAISIGLGVLSLALAFLV